MRKGNVLFVLTNHDQLGNGSSDSNGTTGFHLSEAAIPWCVLTAAGHHVDIASPTGGQTPIDPDSRNMNINANVRFLDDVRIRSQLEGSLALGSVHLDDYDALYFPGGHGTMWDLPDNVWVQRAVRKMYEGGKVVGAVCHGQAAFVNARLSSGRSFVDGKALSVFTDDEERAVGKDSVVPFLLESELSECGATINKAENFEKSVTVHGSLITGQNPVSAEGVGEAIRDKLEHLCSKAA